VDAKLPSNHTAALCFYCDNRTFYGDPISHNTDRQKQPQRSDERESLVFHCDIVFYLKLSFEHIKTA
jgi:hypothetical protein